MLKYLNEFKEVILIIVLAFVFIVGLVFVVYKIDNSKYVVTLNECERLDFKENQLFMTIIKDCNIQPKQYELMNLYGKKVLIIER